MHTVARAGSSVQEGPAAQHSRGRAASAAVCTAQRLRAVIRRRGGLHACISILGLVLLLSPPRAVWAAQHQQQRRRRPSSLPHLVNAFPSREDAVEMAALSLLVYFFRDETDDRTVCDLVNLNNYTDQFLNLSIHCHWYHHSPDQGTQVMIVSSQIKNYNAIVFAGTDDLRTSLTDANILTKPFGDGINITVPDPRVRIHAGFDNAVFRNNLFLDIEDRFNRLRATYPHRRLFTTGHSLGAADSVITAVALTLRSQQQRRSLLRKATTPPIIVSLNFGCPQIGNSYWRDFVNADPALQSTLGTWRFVLGWDLVPRLPEFLNHEGHTVQLYRNGSFSNGGGGGAKTVNITAADAYYQHYGSVDLGLAGVPFGWGSKPFIWVPGALESHHIYKYWTVLRDWPSDSDCWIHEFVHIDYNSTDNDDNRPPHVNDDFYVDPPDDDIRAHVDDAVQSAQ